MTIERGRRGVIIAALCLGFAAGPAQAVEPRTSSPRWREAVSSASLWLGLWLGRPVLVSYGKQAESTAGTGDEGELREPAMPGDSAGEAGLFKLKQHVDNPGQTAM